jgi:hypothetical protein
MYANKFKLFLQIFLCTVSFSVAQNARAQIVGEGETRFTLIHPGDSRAFELIIIPRVSSCQAASRCDVLVITKLNVQNGVERNSGGGVLAGTRLKYQTQNSGPMYQMVASDDGCALHDASRQIVAIKKSPSCLALAADKVSSSRTRANQLPAVGVFRAEDRPSVRRFESLVKSGVDPKTDTPATLVLDNNKVDAWNRDVAERLLNVIGNLMRGDTSRALNAIGETSGQRHYEKVNGRIWFLEHYTRKLREQANP